MTYNRRPYRSNFSTPSERVFTADGLDAGYSVAQQSYLVSLADGLVALTQPLAENDPLVAVTVDTYVTHKPTVDSVRASLRVDNVSDAIAAFKDVTARLKAAPQVVAAQQDAQRAQYPGLPGHDKVITTRFAGDCAGCGRRTVAGTDLAVLRSGRWEPWCIACATADPAERVAREAAQRAAAAAEAERVAAERETLNVLTGVAVGLARTAFAAMGMDSHQRPMLRFALPSSTGGNDLDFFTVSVTSNRGVSNGVRVCRVIGGHADQPLALSQGVEALKRLTDGDIVAACRMYGQHLGYCCRCGRHLTDEASRRAGIGPDCASR